MTNFEKIKNMTIEEMADNLSLTSDYLCEYYDCEDCLFYDMGISNCTMTGLIRWLEDEVEE